MPLVSPAFKVKCIISPADLGCPPVFSVNSIMTALVSKTIVSVAGSNDSLSSASLNLAETVFSPSFSVKVQVLAGEKVSHCESGNEGSLLICMKAVPCGAINVNSTERLFVNSLPEFIKTPKMVGETGLEMVLALSKPFLTATTA